MSDSDLTEREWLLAELQSHSRNTLSVIRSLLRHSVATTQTAQDFAEHLEGRLGAHARAQAAVIRDPAGGVDFASLLSEELLAHGLHEGGRITVRGPDVRLRPRAAELLALVFNELILNAIKFGALKCGGRVDAHWALQDEADGRSLRFSWRESGMRADAPAPVANPPGFGTELIERQLRSELDARGRLTHEAGGSHCEIVLPAATQLVAAT